VPVLCGTCKKTFTVQPDLPAARPGEAPELLLSLTPRLDVAAATTPGVVRERNEDCFLVQHLAWAHRDRRHEVALLVVADGMGGHGAGDEASGQAVRAVGGGLAALLGAALGGQLPRPDAPRLAEAVESALKEANRAVLRKAGEDPACKGMGATAVAVLVWDELAAVAHVGDCRVYHLRAGRLSQVTKDQTLVARMVELGKLTPQEALTHPGRHEVTQAVGRQAELAPGRAVLQLQPGDWLLAACDGLHAHVGADELQDLLARSPAAAEAAEELTDLVNRRGGSDNCTVVAVRCY
jgi:protein phosphatase